MSNERLELVLKAAATVEELREKRAKMTTAIDLHIRRAEAELQALIGNGSAEAEQVRQPTRQDDALDLLRHNPRIGVAQITRDLYGEVSPQSLQRTRSLLYTLRKKGQISGTDGDFEVLIDT